MEGRMFFRSAAVPATVVAAIAFALPACAESCGKSRDYILSNAAGDLPKKPQVYQELFKLCVDTLQLPNVKDAFVLKAGAIGVIPKIDGMAATAGTLMQFCSRHRTATLRFVTRREVPDVANIVRAIELPIANATSCRRITGNG